MKASFPKTTVKQMAKVGARLRVLVRAAHGNAIADHELMHWLAESLSHRGATFGMAREAAVASSQHRADIAAAKMNPAKALAELREFEAQVVREKGH